MVFLETMLKMLVMSFNDINDSDSEKVIITMITKDQVMDFFSKDNLIST